MKMFAWGGIGPELFSFGVRPIVNHILPVADPRDAGDEPRRPVAAAPSVPTVPLPAYWIVHVR